MRALIAGTILAVSSTVLFGPYANANHNGVCVDSSAYNTFLGESQTQGREQGARAYIDSQALHQCNSPTGDDDRGTSAWVGVGGPTGATIVQMGIVRCFGLGFGYCDGSQDRVFAWGRDPAAPGCAGMSIVYPTGTNVGVAETSGAAREYKVVHAGGQWNGYVGALKEAAVLESKICWTPESVLYFTETQDRGDAHGGEATNHLYFNEARALDIEGGTWATQDFGTSCDTFFPLVNPDVYKCAVDAQDRDTMKMWTDR